MTESQESIMLANWLRANNYMFAKSPNETYTKSWNQKRKNTLEGVSSGFPDYTIILKRKSLLFIELKKERGKKGGMNGSKYSEKQIDWINNLMDVDNVHATFAHGAQEAINLITSLELGHNKNTQNDTGQMSNECKGQLAIGMTDGRRKIKKSCS